MSIENDIPRYTPKSIAASLGISVQWARTLCRRTVGRRPVYRLTETQFNALKYDFERYRHEIA